MNKFNMVAYPVLILLLAVGGLHVYQLRGGNLGVLSRVVPSGDQAGQQGSWRQQSSRSNHLQYGEGVTCHGFAHTRNGGRVTAQVTRYPHGYVWEIQGTGPLSGRSLDYDTNHSNGWFEIDHTRCW